MTLDKLAFVDFRDDEYDQQVSEDEHMEIFGHWKTPGDDGKCTHEVHGRIQQAMNGAKIITEFEPELIVTEDSRLAKEREDRYRMIFNATKQMQREIEAEEKVLAARKAGLITAGRVY